MFHGKFSINAPTRRTGPHRPALVILFALAATLGACGGGGSSPTPAPAPAVVTPPAPAPVAPPPPPDPLTGQPSVNASDATGTFNVALVDIGGDGGGDSGSGGGAGDGAPIKRARVVVIDRTGRTVSGQTNDDGNYFVKFPSSFQAPIVTRVITPAGVIYSSASNESPAAGKILRLNINPLTDKIVSDALAGTVKGTDKAFTGADIDATKLTVATADMLSSVRSALNVAGITTTAAFDPVKSVYAYNGTGVDAVLESIAHTRNPNTGATELRAKLAGLNVDADGAARATLVSSTTPLATTQVAIPTTPALNFAKLNAWVSALNQCIATGVATGPACRTNLFSSNFLQSSRTLDEDFATLLSETGRLPVVGSVVRNPVVLAVLSSVGSAIDDIAVVEVTIRQPRTGPLAGNRTTPIEYTKVIVFRRDDVLTGASAGNWLAHGNQRPFIASVNTRYVRRVQNNPAMQADAAGQDPSRIESRLQFQITRSRYDAATNSYVDAGIRAVRIKGPGLSAAGLVMTPSSVPGTTWLGVHNKIGSIPLTVTTTALSNDSFTLNWSTLNGQPLAQTWPSASVSASDAPLANFAGLASFARYTVEVFRVGSASPSVADTTFTMSNLAEVTAPAALSGVVVHDLSPSVALVTAPAPGVSASGPSGSSVKVRWVNNANATPVSQARVFGQSGGNIVDYGANVDNAFVINSQATDADVLTPFGLPGLRVNNPSEFRSVAIWSRPGRANFENRIQWNNPTVAQPPTWSIVAVGSTTLTLGQTTAFIITGTPTVLLSNGVVEPLLPPYNWRSNGILIATSTMPSVQSAFYSPGTFGVTVSAATPGGLIYTSSPLTIVATNPSAPFVPSLLSIQSIAGASVPIDLTATGMLAGVRIELRRVIASSSGNRVETEVVLPTSIAGNRFIATVVLPSFRDYRSAVLCQAVITGEACANAGSIFSNGVLPSPGLTSLNSVGITPAVANAQTVRTFVLPYTGELNQGFFWAQHSLTASANGVWSDFGRLVSRLSFEPSGTITGDWSFSASMTPGTYFTRICQIATPANNNNSNFACTAAAPQTFTVTP